MDPDLQAPDGIIQTARLRLVPLTASALQAIIDGDTDGAESELDVRLPADLGARTDGLFRLRLSEMREQPWANSWFLRAIALREGEHAVVGLAGFHGPPGLDGTVEIGYEVEIRHRRRGYAAEATGALVEWAFDQPGLHCVVAAIRADNEASLGVVRRLGFQPAGSRWDAIEGVALLFERREP